MLPIRHIVMACVTGAALSFGVIGCQPEQRPDYIPSTAMIMDSGNGKIHYTAADDGTVYIYDRSARKLVWSGAVLKGQAVDVDPIKNQVMSNNAIVTMQTLNNGDLNDVYFVPAPITAVAPAAPAVTNNPPPTYNNNGNNPNYNAGVTVTPSVSVQPNNGAQPAGSVTVQPSLNVSPTTQPSSPR